MSGHQPFNYDIGSNGRYVYTGPKAKLSAQTANASQSRMVAEVISARGCRNLLDLGCGDGTFTNEFLQLDVESILGIDPAANAIDFANHTFGDEKTIKFSNQSADDLIAAGAHFDCVILRGVLHHCEDPAEVLLSATRLGNCVIVLEPNGMNPLMKIIEKVSPYHRAHGERSFLPQTITRWFSKADFSVSEIKIGVLVPYFFPDALVRPLTQLDKLVRRIPGIRWILCGTQVLVASPKKA